MSDAAREECRRGRQQPGRRLHAGRRDRGLGPRASSRLRSSSSGPRRWTSPTLQPEQTDREDCCARACSPTRSPRYDRREQEFGDEIMRQLERAILLQIIDNRWREHLYEMDYLREGIHLRGFAQIDPLVAYKNEGFSHVRGADALDLGGVRAADLPRRGRGRPARAGAVRADHARPASSTTRVAPPSSPRRSARRRSPPPPVPTPPPSRRSRAGPQRAATARPAEQETVVKDRPRQDRPQRPLLVRLGQEVQEVPRGVAAARPPISERRRSRRDW